MAQTVVMQIQAHRALRWLAEQGVKVRAVKAAPRRPYIEIDYPESAQLWASAAEMVQQVNGLRRRVWAARLGGCVVTWAETTTEGVVA